MANESDSYEGGELEPLILDGITQVLSKTGQDYEHRDYARWPLSHSEKSFILIHLFKELEEKELHSGLIYLYNHIINYVKEGINYN